MRTNVYRPDPLTGLPAIRWASSPLPSPMTTSMPTSFFLESSTFWWGRALDDGAPRQTRWPNPVLSPACCPRIFELVLRIGGIIAVRGEVQIPCLRDLEDSTLSLSVS
jgi:hypothetical protein